MAGSPTHENTTVENTTAASTTAVSTTVAISRVENTAAENTAAENITAENITVDEAKRRLRQAAAEFDPYALVRKRPLACTGSAFLLGLGWHWARPGRMASGVMIFALQSMGKIAVESLAAYAKKLANSSRTQ